MPTILLKRRAMPRDRGLEFALIAVLVVEVVTMSAAGARPVGEAAMEVLAKVAAPLFVTSTVAEVPCAMLAP